jgi:hypothetical protein
MTRGSRWHRHPANLAGTERRGIETEAELGENAHHGVSANSALPGQTGRDVAATVPSVDELVGELDVPLAEPGGRHGGVVHSVT